MAIQPIAELFGFPAVSETEQAARYRANCLCPYNNKVPSCTKDSVTNPLGVCTIFHGDKLAVICPVRLRQDWMIAEQAAAFFFPPGTRWTTLVEVRLKDKYGKSAGNIGYWSSLKCALVPKCDLGASSARREDNPRRLGRPETAAPQYQTIAD